MAIESTPLLQKTHVLCITPEGRLKKENLLEWGQVLESNKAFIKNQCMQEEFSSRQSCSTIAV
jgi:hypothetical protein